MPTHVPPTTARKTAAGIEPAGSAADASQRRPAIAAILHRVSGGLNNAAMAFELALSPSPSGGGSGSERTFRAGLGGVNQAARAIDLLAELLLPATTAIRDSRSMPLQDVVDILRGRAAARGVVLTVADEIATGDEDSTTPALAAASLLEGLAALESAPPNARLRVRRPDTKDGPVLRFERESALSPASP